MMLHDVQQSCVCKAGGRLGIVDSIEMPSRTLSPAETAAAAEVHVRGSRAPAQRLLRLLH